MKRPVILSFWRNWQMRRTKNPALITKNALESAEGIEDFSYNIAPAWLTVE